MKEARETDCMEKMETCNVMKIGLVRAREEVGEKRRERPREALERISSLFFFLRLPVRRQICKLLSHR